MSNDISITRIDFDTEDPRDFDINHGDLTVTLVNRDLWMMAQGTGRKRLAQAVDQFVAGCGFDGFRVNVRYGKTPDHPGHIASVTIWGDHQWADETLADAGVDDVRKLVHRLRSHVMRKADIAE